MRRGVGFPRRGVATVVLAPRLKIGGAQTSQSEKCIATNIRAQKSVLRPPTFPSPHVGSVVTQTFRKRPQHVLFALHLWQ